MGWIGLFKFRFLGRLDSSGPGLGWTRLQQLTSLVETFVQGTSTDLNDKLNSNEFFPVFYFLTDVLFVLSSQLCVNMHTHVHTPS